MQHIIASPWSTKWYRWRPRRRNHCVLQSLGRSVVRPICFSSLNDIRRANVGRQNVTERRDAVAAAHWRTTSGRAGQGRAAAGRNLAATAPGKPSDDRKNDGDFATTPRNRLDRERERERREDRGGEGRYSRVEDGVKTGAGYQRL